MPSPRFIRSLLPALTLVTVPLTAWAQADADGDGVPDAIDLFPCDASASGASWAPGRDLWGTLLFEDLWPSAGDLDFNDLVLRYHYVLRQDAAGQAVGLRAVFSAAALGGIFDNGLGLRLPVPRSAVAEVTGQVGDGAPEPLALSAVDAEATMRVLGNLRQLFGGRAGPINARASEAREAGANVVVEVRFTQPQPLSLGAAPFDVFLFRSDRPAHEIHRPEHMGTAAMDQSLFGTADDGSSSHRRFVDRDGLPFVLAIPGPAAHPLEGRPISALYPDIIPFAASGGTTHQGFWASAVQSEAYRDLSGRPAPEPTLPVAQTEVSCLLPASMALLTVAPDGAQSNAVGPSFVTDLAISANGRFVAFVSPASNLVDGDTNGVADVFVRDVALGVTRRVSVASSGEQGSSAAHNGLAISADGRFVAFASWAGNLVPGDANNVSDIFVHDLQTGLTERVSEAAGGGDGDAPCHGAAISADGRFVAFSSEASNLVPGGTNGRANVFVRDRLTGALERITYAADGGEPSCSAGNTGGLEISADGRLVLFTAICGDLVVGDTNEVRDAFLHDRDTGETIRVSMAADGSELLRGVSSASMSPDGRFITFASGGVPGLENFFGFEVIHLLDRRTGVIELIGLSPSGQIPTGGSSQGPSVSADGRFVAFHSLANNLVPGDTNGRADVFAFDRQTSVLSRLSVPSQGGQSNQHSRPARIAPSGSFVVFWSGASLVPADLNGSVADVYLAPL